MEKKSRNGLLAHAADLAKGLKKEPTPSDELLREHIKKLRKAHRVEARLNRQVA